MAASPPIPPDQFTPALAATLPATLPATRHGLVSAMQPAAHPARTAWIYVRESDPKQLSGHNPEEQERLCRELAAKEGLTVTRVLWESGSARTMRQRKAFQTVKRGIRAHEFDVLLVWKYSRLHRNLQHQLETFALARAYHVQILAQADPRDEGDRLSKMSIYLSGMLAEFESENIREQSMAGTRARANKGMPLVGNAPVYGFRWVEEAVSSSLTGAARTRKTRLVPDPITGPRVAALFAFLDHPDRSLSQCAAYLNAQGWPSARGGRWKRDSIRVLVHHPYFQGRPEAYRSELVAVGTDEFEVIRKQRRMAPGTSRADAVLLPPESVVSPVDLVVARRVSERLHGRSRHRESPRLLDRERYLLTGGLLRCGHRLPDGSLCHGTLGPRRRHGKANFYACALGASYPSGDPRRHYLSIPAEATDRCTVAWLFQLLLSHEEAEAAVRRLAEREDETSSERQMAEAELRDVERRLARLKTQMELLDPEEIEEEFGPRLRQLRTERTGWQAKLAALDSTQETTERMAVALHRAVAEARANLLLDGDLPLPPLHLAALDTRQPWHLTAEQRADLRDVIVALGFYAEAAPGATGREAARHAERRPEVILERTFDRLHFLWPGLGGQAAAAGTVVGNADIRRRTSSRD